MQEKHVLRCLCVTVVSLFAMGCGPDPLELPPLGSSTHDVQFVGGVYDAASGQRITDYAIEIGVGEMFQVGSVNSSTGRFVLGAVSAFDDYTVHIPLTGYRDFWSHNPRIGLPSGVSDTAGGSHQTRYFDAYLFPSDLETVAATISVRTPEVGEETAGVLRMRPTGVSSISDTETETPAGVSGQVWDNDEDLLGGAITKEFTGGTVSLEAGELVYGVSYQVDIYGVDGYQPLTAAYVAGVDTDKTVMLTPEVLDPLALVVSNDEDCKAPTSSNETEAAVVTMEFNYAVESGDSNNAEVLDDGLSLSSSDTNNNAAFNTLNPDLLPSEQERATSFAFSGKTLTFKFSPKDGLAETDLGDVFNFVSYGDLDNFMVQRTGKDNTKVSISSLIGKITVVCDD